MKLEITTPAFFVLEDIFTGSKFETLKASILAILLRRKDLLFRGSVDPDGIPWQPLARLSERRKQLKNEKITSNKRKQKMTKILVDTGNLKNSISILNSSGSIQSIQGDEITIGTNVEYAAIHNFGGTIQKSSEIGLEKSESMIIIPARPFIGFGIDDEKAVNEKLESYISKNSRAS